MEELHCKGTPAQIVRRVLAVLATDPDVLWLIDSEDAYPAGFLDSLDFYGRTLVDIPNDQEFVRIMVLHGEWPVIGFIEAERLPAFVLVTASNLSRCSIWNEERGDVSRSLVEDFGALAPIWERVKAELHRLGLVIETEPAPNVNTSIIIVGNGNVVGDGSSSRVLQGTPATPIEAAARPTGSSWNTVAIRDLLNAAFNDEELTSFCFDYFRSVYHDFALGMSKGQKEQRLLDYCERHEQVDDLLAAVRQANPKRYQRFAGQLTG
jgi:hypothetical protein